MRLIGILITVVILALLITYSIKRLYTPTSNPAGLDTSYPAVERQVDRLQNTTQQYNNALQQQQSILEQNQAK